MEAGMEMTEKVAPIEENYNTYSNKYNINMRYALYGVILEIGCQTIALSSETEAKKLINYYIDNKKECLQKYNNDTVEELIEKVLKNK